MDPIKGTTSDHNAPAANTAAVITYTANATKRHVVGQIIASYTAAPTGGNLKVEDGAGTTIFEVDIAAVSPSPINVVFDPPLSGSYNTAMVITLAAGGAGISGKVTARHWTY